MLGSLTPPILRSRSIRSFMSDSLPWIFAGRRAGFFPSRRESSVAQKPAARPSNRPAPEFRQCRFACSSSFGHRFEKVRLLHRLALARSVNLPPPGFGGTPFVLHCKRVFKGVETRHLFHRSIIGILTGEAQVPNGHYVISLCTLPRTSAQPLG